MSVFGYNYTIVSWTLYSVGMFMIGCRVASRRLQIGSFFRFQLDDWLMLFVGITFTVMIVTSNILSRTGSNYLPPGVLEKLTQSEREILVYGSKIAMVMEESTQITLWLIKACLLLLYHRFTVVLRRNAFVIAVAWYCVLGFATTQILLLGVWCRPFKFYWALEVENQQCITYHHHLIVSTVFNISSDLLLIFIPLPLLIASKLTLQRKLTLCIVFSLGIFVILAAALNRYFSFALPYNPHFLNWYAGEVSCAVMTSNIPLCWPLIRRIFSLDEFSTSPHPYLGPPPVHTPDLAPYRSYNNPNLPNQHQNQKSKSAPTTVRSQEIIVYPFPSRPAIALGNNKPLPRTPMSAGRHSKYDNGGEGVFEEIHDLWVDMLASSEIGGRERRVDEEKAVGWRLSSPVLDLVDYRTVSDMHRANRDEIVLTVRVSQYSEVGCGV